MNSHLYACAADYGQNVCETCKENMSELLMGIQEIAGRSFGYKGQLLISGQLQVEEIL